MAEQIVKRKVQQSAGTKMTPEPPKTEDRVVEDIKGATGFFKTLPGKVKSTLQAQKSSLGQNTPSASSTNLPINLNSKLIRILIIIVVSLLVLLIIGNLYRALSGRRSTPSDTPIIAEETTPTPTIIFEISITPAAGESIYANDPTIKKIDDDLDILSNEMQTTPLRESLLIPPTLDYNISF